MEERLPHEVRDALHPFAHAGIVLSSYPSFCRAECGCNTIRRASSGRHGKYGLCCRGAGGMTQRLHWFDAQEAVESLAHRPFDQQLLGALVWLPLVPARVLERLFMLRGGAMVYRSVSRLREDGLIDAIRPPLYAGSSAHLYYLTDLGLAAVALRWRVDLSELTRRCHLRGSDLLATLPSLPHVVATYDLLGALADSGVSCPRWVAWQRPWRCRYRQSH
jgi:Replication-relaxation